MVLWYFFIVDDVVDALGGNNPVADIVEVAIHAADRDGESLRGVESCGSGGAIWNGEEGDVRADEAGFAREGGDADEAIGGKALIDFLELADLGAEGPFRWAVGDENDERAAAEVLRGFGFSGGVDPREVGHGADDFGMDDDM